MNCTICGKEDWESVDEHRVDPTEFDRVEKKEVPVNMCICKECGFVTYPTRWNNEDDIKKYYKNEYRRPPSMNNISSGQRKMSHHHAFLDEYLKEWIDGKKEMTVCDVGAAFGMYLDWFKAMVPGSKAYGTEWSQSFRRNAYHMYGLNLSEDFDDSIKYDLISSYHVLEHQLEPDKELRKYVRCLKPGGRIYLSTPIWFEEMFYHGYQNMELKDMYSKDHLNVWTDKLLRTLIAKCGLEIEKENVTYNGRTFMLKVAENKDFKLEKDDPEKVKEVMGIFKEVFLAKERNEYKKCIELWPNSILAWKGLFEFNRPEYHRMGYEKTKEEFIDKMIKACPTNAEVYGVAGDVAMRFSKWNEAIDLFKEGLRMIPNATPFLSYVANCYRQLSAQTEDFEQKMSYLLDARDISRKVMAGCAGARDDAMNWTMSDQSKIPTPMEMGKEAPDASSMEEGSKIIRG